MEIMLIFLAILLLFGAKRIPEIAKGLGKGIREFKQATQDISNEIQSASDSANRPRVIEPPRQAPVSRQDTAQQANSSNSGTAAE
ncbi:MAG: twin-arginine translocase TatA/TatE family subunit [Bacteroidota bacterium]